MTGAASPLKVPPIKSGGPPTRVVPACAGMLIPTPAVFVEVRFIVTMFAFMVNVRFAVTKAFDVHTFPVTFRVAPPPALLIPMKPVVEQMVEVFKDSRLALVSAKTLGAASAFEAHALPAMFSRAQPLAPPIPTLPVVEKMVEVFKDSKLALVNAKTFGVARAFEAHALPAMLSVAPVPMTPIPTDPEVPDIDVVFRI